MKISALPFLLQKQMPEASRGANAFTKIAKLGKALADTHKKEEKEGSSVMLTYHDLVSMAPELKNLHCCSVPCWLEDVDLFRTARMKKNREKGTSFFNCSEQLVGDCSKNLSY
jgi:hypothetical protein